MTGKELTARVMSSKEIRESKALEDYLQRNLKPRVSKIAAYIKKRDDRFFNSIILGVFEALPDWIQLDLSSLSSALDEKDCARLEETLGVLVFSGGEKMFAIDGQHRVEGIKLAHASSDESLAKDQYSVLMVAHVDDVPGKVRTRRLFCDINKNAVAVSDGDKVIIDEDDLCAITTRRIFAEYAAFNSGLEIAVSERKEVLTQIDKDGRNQECFTSLLALYTVTKKLKPIFKKQKGAAPLAPENVSQLQSIVSDFLDFVIEVIPSYKAYFAKKTTLTAERRNNKNLLFRPIGLEILGRVYASAYADNQLQKLRARLPKVAFTNPGGPFERIIWSAGKIKAGSKEKGAAVDLVSYLCGLRPVLGDIELRDRLRVITQDSNYKLPPKNS